MNITLFLFLFCALGVLYLFLGIAASKDIKDNDDYFLAGRGLGLVPLTFTLVATQLGGGVLLGTSHEAYNNGFFGILYTLGFAMGFLILGLGFAAKLRSFNVSTTVELFETKYGSPLLKKFGSLLMIISLCLILVGQVVGTRALISGLGITSQLPVVLFWLFVIGYTMLGGLKAVVITDVVQVLVILAVFTTVFVWSLLHEPASFFSFAKQRASQASFGASDLSFNGMFGLFLMPVLFSLIEQDMAQRFFAAKNKRTAAVAALLAALLLVVFLLIPVYFGMKARLLGLAVPLGSSPLMVVLDYLTNDWVMAFVSCGIIAAIVSTADSLLCAISSNIVLDFDFSRLGIKRTLAFSQLITLLVGIGSLVVGYFFSDILSVLRQSYELPVSCLFVPIFLCFFKDTGLSRSGAYASCGAGLVGFFVFRAVPMPIPREIATLALSALGYVFGMLLDRQKQDKHYNSRTNLR